MGDKRSKTEKIEGLKIGLNAFMKASETEVGKALSDVREEMQRSLTQKFSHVPSKLKNRLDSVSDAFMQLSKVKQVLHHAQYDDNEQQRATLEGRRCMESRSYEEALRYFQHAMNLDGENVELLLLAGTAAIYAKAYPEATFYADQLLERNPRDYQALTLKGLVNMALGQNEVAKRHFETALKIRPDHPVIGKYLAKLRSGSDISQKLRPKRKWVRRPLKKKIHVNDYGLATVATHQITSLSAGGCMIKATELPTEFQFNFQLANGEQVWGVGKISYQLPDGLYGVKFENVSIQDEEAINREVLARAS